MPRRRTRKAGKKQKKTRQKGGYVYSSRGPFDAVNSFYSKDTHTVPMTSELFNYMNESKSLIQPDPFQVLLGDYDPKSEAGASIIADHKDGTPIPKLVRETGFMTDDSSQFRNVQLEKLIQDRAKVDAEVLKTTEAQPKPGDLDFTTTDDKPLVQQGAPDGDLTAAFTDDADPFVRDADGKITGISADITGEARDTIQRSLDSQMKPDDTLQADAAAAGGRYGAGSSYSGSSGSYYNIENRQELAGKGGTPTIGGGKRKRRKTRKHKKKGGKKGGRKGKRSRKH